MARKSSNAAVVETEEEVVAPVQEVLGQWKVHKYLRNTESLNVAKGITVGLSGEAPDFEINIVGTKSNHICGSVEEARSKAKEMLRDFLENALSVLKGN